MHGVAELVEHRGHVGEAEERGLPRRGLGEVADVEDDRAGAAQPRLIHERVHPGAAVLVVALEVVRVEERERFTLGVEHLEHLHVGVVDGEIVALHEGEPVELVGREEYALAQHAAELEVGLDLGVVEGEVRLAHLLGVELPVPRRELVAGLLVVDELLHARRLLARLGDRRRGHVGEELDRRGGRLGHLVAEHVGRPGGVAEELGLACAELGQAPHEGAGVVGVAVLGALGGGLEEALAHRPVRERHLRRLLRRVLEGEDPLALELAPAGRLGRGRDVACAEALEIRLLVDHDSPGLVRRQEPLREIGAEGRLLLVERGELRLGLGRELGAGVDEIPPVALGQVPGLGVHPLAVLVERLHAGVELGVQVDGVLVGGELGGHALLDLLERVAGVGARHGGEHLVHARQELAAPLERHDGVVEGRRPLPAGDAGDLGELLRHARVDGGLVVAVVDLVEGGRLIEERARFEERVLGRGGRRRRFCRGRGRGRRGHDGRRFGRARRAGGADEEGEQEVTGGPTHGGETRSRAPIHEQRFWRHAPDAAPGRPEGRFGPGARDAYTGPSRRGRGQDLRRLHLTRSSRNVSSSLKYWLPPPPMRSPSSLTPTIEDHAGKWSDTSARLMRTPGVGTM